MLDCLLRETSARGGLCGRRKGNCVHYGNFSRVSRTYASSWAHTALALPKLVILDTETTGQSWHGGQDEIVEICVIDKAGTPLINTLVHPHGPIHPDAARVSGITDDLVAGAPSFDAVAEVLANILRGRGVIIYNASYDTPLLQIEFVRCDCAFPPCNVRCAMLAYAAYRQIPGRQPGEYKRHKLTDACAHEGIVPSQKAHRALADCLATLDLLRCMAR